MNRTHDLLRQYDESVSLLSAFGTELNRLLDSLLTAYRTQPISCRLKSRSSLEKKIESKSGKYESLAEITDIVGLRIITFFSDEIDRIASVLEREFDVDRENSVDRRKIDIDRFGYQSLHYVLKLSHKRQTLPEFARFSGLKAEIQIRTVLQHAWAEIEHDIGYKSDAQLPVQLRRPFYRAAALLETADDLFLSLRQQHDDYRASLPARIRDEPQTVLLDQSSLGMFLTESQSLRELDTRIASFSRSSFHASPDSESRMLEDLSHFGVRTIGDLESALLKHGDDLIALYSRIDRRWLDYLAANPHKQHNPSMPNGVSIFYLTFLLAARSNDSEFIKKYYSDPSIVLRAAAGDLSS